MDNIQSPLSASWTAMLTSFCQRHTDDCGTSDGKRFSFQPKWTNEQCQRFPQLLHYCISQRSESHLSKWSLYLSIWLDNLGTLNVTRLLETKKRWILKERNIIFRWTMPLHEGVFAVNPIFWLPNHRTMSLNILHASGRRAITQTSGREQNSEQKWRSLDTVWRARPCD